MTPNPRPHRPQVPLCQLGNDVEQFFRLHDRCARNCAQYCAIPSVAVYHLAARGLF